MSCRDMEAQRVEALLLLRHEAALLECGIVDLCHVLTLLQPEAGHKDECKCLKGLLLLSLFYV